MLVSVDARQRSLGRVEKQPEPGQNIVLTIDEKIQFIAERELQAAIDQRFIRPTRFWYGVRFFARKYSSSNSIASA